MNRERYDYVIVGAGIIGLLTAYQLAKQGQRVHIIDQSFPGRSASWAAGGICSLLYPWQYTETLQQLVSTSQQLYPPLIQELALGEDSYHTSGMLYWLTTDQLSQAIWWAERNGYAYHHYPAQQIVSRWLSLPLHGDDALYLPDMAQVRPPRLLQALCQRLQQSDTVSWSESPAEQLHDRDNGWQIKTADHMTWQAKQIIVTAGWQSQSLLSHWYAVDVFPVRGQMLLFHQIDLNPWPIVMVDDYYYIERVDRQLLFGSTLETDVATDCPDHHGQQQLLAAAQKLLPPSITATFQAHWSGVRPGSHRELPFIGKVPNTPPGLWLCTGHYRYGLTLAPVSVQILLAQLGYN